MQELKQALKSASKNVFNVEVEPELSRPDEKFGDYSTNLAMKLGKRLNKNPKEIAIAVTSEMLDKHNLAGVEIEGPGFINFRLTDKALASAAIGATKLPQPLKQQEFLLEFGDPNPFKEMHIGHLYSYIVGDSISKLLEASGAKVQRLSYHGDVGLHVAKAIWGMKYLGADPSDSKKIGECYKAGAAAYEDDGKAKAEINVINEQIYRKDNPEINRLYDNGKKTSFSYFDEILGRLNIKMDRKYLESESADIGLHLVRANTGKIFKESSGAVIYEGEKSGLHTRVFITSKGLPTYEAKDLGLAELKNRDYPSAAKSVIITAHEQSEYFKVMLAALKEIDEALSDKTVHLWHGFVTLSSGKMSSRKGEIVSALSLLDKVENEATKLYADATGSVHLAAVKYGFLKHRLGSDIVYDVEESISLEGNSGPYLQYAYARACSILSKKAAGAKDLEIILEEAERSLARKIGEYPEVIERAAAEFLPNHITGYLYELAQNFNRFYEKNRVIGSDREALRLQLVEAYAKVLKSGLDLLNVEAPARI